jgi:hypothetical protein
MGRRTPKLLLVLCVTALAGLSAAPGEVAAARAPISIHFTAITKLIKKKTARCPEGAVLVQGTTRKGKTATAELCLLRTNKIRKKTVAIISRATIQLTGVSGKLQALVRIFEVTKGSVAHRTITGVIFPGTGDFSKAGGRVFGKGTIEFPKKGQPKVDLTFTFGFD